MLSVIILTYNEELHLARALASVAPFATYIHIIDSGSTDDTVAIARAHGAEVLTHQFKNQADQFQWAMDHITGDAPWLMRLDADEVIEPDLAERIRVELPGLGLDVAGVTIDRKHIFMGKWIRHGGRYPLTLLRLFRRGHGHVEQRWMDEHIVVEGGRIAHFSGGFADHNLKDLDYFIEKHNRYATREAIEVLSHRHSLFGGLQPAGKTKLASQAAFKRFVKEKIYYRIPFEFAALAYFFHRYIVQLGFLDGRAGFAYHFLQGFWYRYLVGAKIRELDSAIAGLSSREAKGRELARLTGIDVTG